MGNSNKTRVKWVLGKMSHLCAKFELELHFCVDGSGLGVWNKIFTLDFFNFLKTYLSFDFVIP